MKPIFNVVYVPADRPHGCVFKDLRANDADEAVGAVQQKAPKCRIVRVEECPDPSGQFCSLEDENE